jgi:hypothetical protein
LRQVNEINPYSKKWCIWAPTSKGSYYPGLCQYPWATWVVWAGLLRACLEDKKRRA